VTIAGADGPVSDLEVAAMCLALGLAGRGRREASPNPSVGAVLLHGTEIVGQGWTAAFGGPHAEVRALAQAGARARGATAVMTLEPCNHTGRTGPCTVALASAGVVRVVYGATDPGSLAGGGGARLRAAGVQVVAGVLEPWAREVHRTFLHDAATSRPLVTLKLAATADARMAVAGRDWVTGPAARRRVHVLRSRNDAVLVGIGTVLADDPQLDVRHVESPGGQPRPVWIDRGGRTPLDARVVRSGGVVVTGEGSAIGWRKGLAARGVRVVIVVERDGRLDLAAAVTALRGLGIVRLLAEPGPGLASGLFDSGLVDDLVLHIAPDVAGVAGLPTVPPALWAAPSSHEWVVRSARPLGLDREVVVRPRR